MITELKLHNWKSFSDATLYIDPLTFVIGLNASGKSNIFDALGFLRKIAENTPVNDAIALVRGGEEWILKKGTRQFSLSVTIEEQEQVLLYSITFEKNVKAFRIAEERLTRKGKDVEKVLFATLPDEKQRAESGTITTNFMASRGEKSMELSRNVAAIAQVEIISVLKEIKEASACVVKHLKQIFVFNPVPSAMRGYSSVSDELHPDAGNVAGVLANLDEKQKGEVEELLTKYIKPLPERDLNRIWAEKVGRFGSDAMLYCEENWTGDPIQLDAKGMSDGTLRFTAIVMALLTVAPHSLLVIEEIDNGLHPSRAQELVKVLRELGNKRSIDVLCSTHNPELVDSLGNSMLPFISYVKRDSLGASNIFLLEDKDNLPKLLAGNSLGDMMKNDLL